MSDFKEILDSLSEYDVSSGNVCKTKRYEKKSTETDLLKNYGPNFWMTYGTGIRNIAKHLVPMYKQAIAESGIPGLAILPHNYRYPKDTTVSSLHCYSGYRDLTDFWKIVDDLNNGRKEILPHYLNDSST
jgi:hypothetical protein